MLKFLKIQTQNKQNYSSTSRRFLAYFIDVTIVTLIRYFLAIIFFFLWLKKSMINFSSNYYNANQSSKINTESLSDMLSFLAQEPIFYEIIFVIGIIGIVGSLYWILLPTTKLGATLGKYFLKIKIVTIDNKPLTKSLLVRRYIAGAIPWVANMILFVALMLQQIPILIGMILLIVLWYDPSLIRNHKRTIHDYMCKTKVVNRDNKRVKLKKL
jgi:uncharacterized RDD family membrane protein YckC